MALICGVSLGKRPQISAMGVTLWQADAGIWVLISLLGLISLFGLISFAGSSDNCYYFAYISAGMRWFEGMNDA